MGFSETEVKLDEVIGLQAERAVEAAARPLGGQAEATS